MTKIKKNCKECGKGFEVEKSECFGFDFSNVVSVCSQKCLEDIHKRKLEEEAERDKQKRLSASFNAFESVLKSYPKKYIGAKIDDFENIKEDWMEFHGTTLGVKKLVERWLTGSYWCFFLRSEQPDTGKTRLGLVVLAELAKIGYFTEKPHTKNGYIKAPLMASLIESERFESSKPITDGFIDSDVLFIDDLGTEKDTQADLIAYVLDEREQDDKRTILTTNLNNQNISLRYGGRFLSRVNKGIMEKKGINRR